MIDVTIFARWIIDQSNHSNHRKCWLQSCLTKILKCTSFGVKRDITISILNQNKTEAVLCADHCTSRHLKDITASLPVACHQEEKQLTGMKVTPTMLFQRAFDLT